MPNQKTNIQSHEHNENNMDDEYDENFMNLDYLAQAPLSHIRILDFSSVIMGPSCTQTLADYGAKVVKIEPLEGDIMRHAGARQTSGMGSMFIHANRNKESLALDLKHPESAKIIARLLPDFDVLIHNIRPQAMERLGLDYEQAIKHRPDLIYVALSGYASEGPYAQRPAFDDIIQAEAGLAKLYEQQNQSAPAYLPTLIADRLTGTVAVHRTLAALYHRAQTGQGQYLNVSMFETLAELVLADHLGGYTFEPQKGPAGYSRLLTPNRRPYQTADSSIAVVLYTNRHWLDFFKIVGDPNRAEEDVRFSSAAQRADHIDAIYSYLSEQLKIQTTAHWLDVLRKADIPCAPVREAQTLLDDEHLKAIDFFTWLEDEHGNRFRTTRNRNAADRINTAPPRLGQHSQNILARHGFTHAEIETLLQQHVIQTEKS